MRLGPVNGPLTIDEYERVCKFTTAVEEMLSTYVLGRQLKAMAEIRYAELPEYPLLAVKFTWTTAGISYEEWRSLRVLEELESEHESTYSNSVRTLIESALTVFARWEI